MISPLRKLVGVLTAMTIAPAFAQTAPPEVPFADMSSGVRSKAKPASRLRMGALNVRFEETTLKAVSDAAGLGTINHRGDAGESIYWLCYTIRDSSKSQRIWIVASGEMGGPEHAVTEITAQELSTSVEPTDDCPTLPSTLQPVLLAQDIWLGSPEGKALKTLGRASRRKGSWRLFYYEGKLPGSCPPDGGDLGNWLMFRTAQGRIVTINAGQVTSC